MNIQATQPVIRIMKDKPQKPQIIKRDKHKITHIPVNMAALGKFSDYLKILAFLIVFVGGGSLAAELVVRIKL